MFHDFNSCFLKTLIFSGHLNGTCSYHQIGQNVLRDVGKDPIEPVFKNRIFLKPHFEINWLLCQVSAFILDRISEFRGKSDQRKRKFKR